jgi:hypothetical protein
MFKKNKIYSIVNAITKVKRREKELKGTRFTLIWKFQIVNHCLASECKDCGQAGHHSKKHSKCLQYVSPLDEGMFIHI